MQVWKIWSEQKGAIAIIIGILLVVFLGFVALVIDIGFGLVTKNELHNVADAAALAGTRQLGRIYTGLPDFSAQQNYVLTPADRAAIIAEIQDAAQKNTAGGQSISINTADIRIGQWNVTNRTLTVTNILPDAVEVTARRDATANGPITTFFAQIMGINTLSVTATSTRNGRQEEPTAALTGISEVLPGELDIPVAISEQWFRNQALFCDQNIRFYPTNDPVGCAGWNTFLQRPSNASTLRNILQGLNAGTYQTPGGIAGQTQFEFIGGNVANALNDLKALYDTNCVVNPTSGICAWETFVTVYQSTNCSNPSGAITIVGFASVTITNVLAPPVGQLIEGRVQCDVVQPNARGGGAEFGTKGSIPGLVQ